MEQVCGIAVKTVYIIVNHKNYNTTFLCILHCYTHVHMSCHIILLIIL